MPEATTYKFKVGDRVRVRPDVTERELMVYALNHHAPSEGEIEEVIARENAYWDVTRNIQPMIYRINGWTYPEHILEHVCKNHDLRLLIAACNQEVIW